MPGMTREQIDPATRSLWRYRAAFPLHIDDPITLGEGCTPLIPRTVAGVRVLLKCEWFNPTCSFKDRGASVMLSLLRAQGIDARAGGQLRQRRCRGVRLCRGRRHRGDHHDPGLHQPGQDGADARARRNGRADPRPARTPRMPPSRALGAIFYASHNWHPFFLHGTKTLAYELWEDLGFRAPDNIITPCGAGSNVLGCQIGFSELLRAGQIDAMPRIFAAQPANCAPIAAAFMAGADEPCRAITPTIAEGTAIAHAVRLREVLGTLRETRGGAVTLTEAEIGVATLELARIGIYVEPTCAQAGAAFGKLLATGTITPEQTTVLVMTGTGLKATPRIAELLGVTL